jgi:hypothetical protein
MADDTTPDRNTDSAAAPGFNAAAGNGENGGGGAQNAWHYWHGLRAKARLDQWDEVETLLAENAGIRLPYQDFVADVFHRAANQGRLTIVQTLFKRGFSLPEEEGAETIKRLAVFFPDKALPVAAFLCAHADEKDALYAVAARGNPSTMQAFQKAGCDVLTEGSSFFLAFYAGNADMLRYLGGQGANIYASSVIAGRYGRSGEMDAQKAPEALLAYKWLLEEDLLSYRTYYAYIAPHQPDIAALRGVPPAVAEEGQTLLALAVRGGFMEDILAAAQKKDAPALRAEDFLRQDKKGLCPLAVLAARGELDKVFDVRLWQKSPAEAARLQAALKDFRAEAAVDMAKFNADLRLHHLQSQAKKSPLRLGRRPG